MNDLDQNVCYQALLSKDARFDGCFFVGVRTTGIYCRPICPAKKAKLMNVKFFQSAAAAENAGFRPCKRCHPEAAPGSSTWNGVSSALSKALHLIDTGVLDNEGVNGVASALGISSRQLSRLFAEHLGASPGIVAQTRRAHFAKKLIDQTDIPMSTIALSSGFSSIRRFNAQIQATFGESPTSLRSKSATHPRPTDGTITLFLPYRPPFAWEQLLQFLSARAIPGVEWVSDGIYRRTISLHEQVGMLEVSMAERPNCLQARLSIPAESIRPIVIDRIRNMFDLGANPTAIAEHLGRDRVLAPLLRRLPGLRVPGAWDGFELAVRAILGQQVSVQAATTLSGRLVKAFGSPLPSTQYEGVSHVFPEPVTLVDARIETIGLPSSRAQAIRDLAHAVANQALKLDGTLSANICVEALQNIRGIGAWTASYIAMRALRDPDAFPVGDLGIQRKLSSNGKRAAAAIVARRAEAWRPWRAYAAMYLWNG